MRFRKWRIAWSVGCAAACVLLVVLWVRSYWWMDSAWNVIPAFGTTNLVSDLGDVRASSDTSSAASTPSGWKVWSYEQADSTSAAVRLRPWVRSRFTWKASAGRCSVSAPHWSLVMISATAASLPWINRLRWRFSLRTLLIATTLVAAVLGLVVYFMRS